MSEDNRYQDGLKRRREILGAEYVDKAVQRTDPFNEPLQNIITKNVWGDVWSREALPRRERSLITLTLLILLNRPHELRLHLAVARRNGCTLEEIRELLIHVSAYCGAPIAVDAARHANEVFAEEIAQMAASSPAS